MDFPAFRVSWSRALTIFYENLMGFRAGLLAVFDHISVISSGDFVFSMVGWSFGSRGFNDFSLVARSFGSSGDFVFYFGA